MKHSRLPRRVRLGHGYVIEVVLAPQSVLRDIAQCEEGELLDGFWEPCLGQDGTVAGRIYVHDRLPAAQKWATYWHELIHAVNDIAAWDKTPGVVT